MKSVPRLKTIHKQNTIGNQDRENKETAPYLVWPGRKTRVIKND